MLQSLAARRYDAVRKGLEFMAILTDPITVSHCGPTVFLSYDQERTIVWLAGEHDIASAWRVRNTLGRAIARDDADLVVDLSETDFMDASTIGTLVRARNLLLAQNRTLTIRAPSRSARRVLDIVGSGELIDPMPRTRSAVTTEWRPA